MAEVVAVRAALVIIKVIPSNLFNASPLVPGCGYKPWPSPEVEFVFRETSRARVGLGIELLTPKQRH